MSLSDVTIIKRTGGLGRRSPGGDMISGLLANGVDVSGGVQIGTPYRLASIQDALALLIDEAYDTTNNVLVYEHIKEFFRINSNGDLWLMLLPKAENFKDMVDPAKEANALKLLQAAGGAIRQLGVAYNPAVTVADDTALVAAIAKAQELAVYAYSVHMPVEIILEGKGYDLEDAVDFRSLNAEGVTVMVGQSLSVANTGGNETYAAVGTLLGAVSKAAVNENVGWVQEFNVMGGSLQAAAISGVAYQNIGQGKLNTLNDEGAVFFRTHIGRPGYYFNDSHTCTDLLSDYAYIEMNRTIHKAVRLVREALLPRVNSPVLIDAENGTLSPEVIKSIENDGNRALEAMLSNQEVSAMDVYVDPAQNILATSELQVSFSLVPTGTARQINVTIGFENPF